MVVMLSSSEVISGMLFKLSTDKFNKILSFKDLDI